jgi:uncharacterized membrane protein
MNKSRLEAFSDGVFAIIITVLVLELEAPTTDDLSDLIAMWPKVLSYMLSFVNIGIYWINHHHLLSTVKRVNGIVLWANLHLCFWLSLMPLTTEWLGTHSFSSGPMILYSLDLFMCGIAYSILQSQIIKLEGSDSVVRQAVRRDLKGKISLAGYMIAVILAITAPPWVAGLTLSAIACVWLIPDSRIEKLHNRLVRTTTSSAQSRD